MGTSFATQTCRIIMRRDVTERWEKDAITVMKGQSWNTVRNRDWVKIVMSKERLLVLELLMLIEVGSLFMRPRDSMDVVDTVLLGSKT